MRPVQTKKRDNTQPFLQFSQKKSSLKKGTQTQINKRYQKYNSLVTSKSSRLEEVYHRSQILLPIFSQNNQHMEISRQEKK